MTRLSGSRFGGVRTKASVTSGELRIVGGGQVGDTLSLVGLPVIGDGPDLVYQPQWYRDGVVIPDADGATFYVDPLNGGHTITATVRLPNDVVITAVNSVGIPAGNITVSWDPAQAAVSAAYSSAPMITGGTGAYTVALTAGFSLPPGFTLDAETGEVASANPTTEGSYPISLTVTDTGGAVAVVAATIVVVGIPAALTAGAWSVGPAQGQPGKAVFTYAAPVPAGVASARYQAIAAAASTGWSGNFSVTGAVAPVADTPYVCIRDVPTTLVGKSIKVRTAFVYDLGQTTINFSGSDVKTIDLAPLVSGVAVVGGALQGTVTFTTTGASGIAYMAPVGSVDAALSPADQALAVKAASVARGSAWQKTVAASGAQTHVVTGLPAGATFASVHVVHEIAGVLGNWSAGSGFQTDGAAVVSLTVTEPVAPLTILDGGTFEDFLSDQVAAAPYVASGTAQGFPEGSQIDVALSEGFYTGDIKLLDGLPVGATNTQLLDTIEARAPIWFGSFVATDPRSAAEFAADTPNTSLIGSYTLRITGGTAESQMTIEGVDLGDVGIWVDGPFQVTLNDVRCAGVQVTGGGSVNGTNIQIVGRGDGSEIWAGGWPNDAVKVDGGSDFDVVGLLIAGHCRDALKHGASNREKRGRFRIRVAHIGAPTQWNARPLPYDPLRSYIPGDVFKPPVGSSGVKCWRVLQPFTDYLSTSGQTDFPPLSSAGSNAYLLYQDLHADVLQDLGSNEMVTLYGVVINSDVTQRLTQVRNLESMPTGNAAVFVSYPDPRGVFGYSDFAVMRIRDPQGWIKGVQVVGTTTSGGIVRPPARAMLRSIEFDDTTLRFDLGGDSDVVYRDLSTVAGVPINPAAPAVNDLTLPPATVDMVIAALPSVHRIAQGPAVVTNGAWSKALSVPYSGAMTWAIEAASTGTALVARSVSVLRTDLAAPATYAVGINALAYDKVIFDSGFAIGRNAAVVPVSGPATGVPNGLTVEARAVHYDDLTDTPTGAATAWTAVSTTSGGAYFGTLSVPRVPGTWSRVEVRVQGSSAAPAAGVQRFAAGHVWAMYEQSNWAQVFESTETLPAAAVTDPEAVQVFKANRTTGVATRSFITTATPMAPGVVALANVFAAERPGEKLAIAAHVLSGTSPQEMIAEPQVNARKWDHEVAINDLITQCGQQVGVVWNMGWISWNSTPSNAAEMMPIFVGKEITGAAVAPGATTAAGYVLSHDLREFYDFWNGTTGYTRAAFCGAHGKGVTVSKTNWLTGADDDHEKLNAKWREVMADTANFPEMLYCAATNDGALRGEDNGAGGWQDTIHHHGHVDWGRNRLARIGMMNALQAVGLASWPTAEFNRVHWATDGSHADFWMDGYNVTTERNRTGGASVYVRGWSLDGQILTTEAQIVADAGGSGFAGVRITPPAGYGPFTYASAIDYGRGELPGFQTYPGDYQNDYVLDLAVIDVGAAGMPALPVRTRSAGELANTLPAPAMFTVTSTAGPHFADPNTIGSNSGLLTMRAKMRWTGGGGTGLFTISSANMEITRLSDGSLRLVGLKDSGGTGLLATQGLAGTAPTGNVVDIVVTMNLGAQVFRVFVDGVLTDDKALNAGTGQFASGRNIIFFTNAGRPNADVEILEVWKAYAADGNTAALGTPYKRVAGGAVGAVVETPTTPVWRVG